MKDVSLFLDVEPVAWQRPKTRIVNGWVQHYSPSKTKNYEKLIAEMYRHRGKVYWEKDEPICISIHFSMPIPKSTPTGKRAKMVEGDIAHTKRPDVDNLTKSILDALNGVAWADDSQIVQLCVVKQYAEKPSIWLHIFDSEGAE